MATAQLTSRSKLTGICPPARGAVLAELLLTHAAPVWLVVASELRTAETLAEDIAFFHGAAGGKSPPEVLVFPESLPDSRDMREAFAASSDRLTVLSKLRAQRSLSAVALPAHRRLGEGGAKADQLIILTTPAALLQSVPTLEAFATHELTLTCGQRQPFQELLEKLHAIDYDSEAVCEAPGHYAVRGGIIDVYPVTATQPYRLDFFGDEIESIKAFDPITQRSGEAVDSIALAASPRIKLDPAKSGLVDYLTPFAHLALIEPASLDEAFDVIARDGGPSPAPLLEKCAAVFGVSDLDEASVHFDGAGTEQTWDTESLAHHRSYPDDALVAQERLQVEEDARRKFFQQVAAWQRAGYGVSFVVSKDGEEQRVREILADNPELKKLSPRFLRGTLNEGFRITFRRKSLVIRHWSFHQSRPGRDTALSSSPKPRFLAGSGSAARRCTAAPSRNAPRLTSCWIFPSWSRATSSCTCSTVSRSTAG